MTAVCCGHGNYQDTYPNGSHPGRSRCGGTHSGRGHGQYRTGRRTRGPLGGMTLFSLPHAWVAGGVGLYGV